VDSDGGKRVRGEAVGEMMRGDGVREGRGMKERR
jgi:hypothetical protein